MTDIIVPTLGESVTEATVGAWQVSEGDAVKKDDVLVELETDKVSVEVRAEEDGTVAKIVAAEGDTVEIGAVLAQLGAAGASAAATEATGVAPAQEAPAAETPAPAPAADDNAGGGELVDAKVPVMGESVAEGQVGEWLVQVGDAVEQDQALLEIEPTKSPWKFPLQRPACWLSSSSRKAIR